MPTRSRSLVAPVRGSLQACRRQFSTSPLSRQSTKTKPDPKLVHELRLRIGNCIKFGLRGSQNAEAGAMLKEIAGSWRELIAGSEGFLTGPDRRGLFRQEVVWGEMDIMVSHVNNVAYNRYAESARVNWALQYARHIDPEHAREWGELCTPRGDGLILRSIRTDYKFPMTYPDKVTVYHKLSSSPEPSDDSFWLDAIILSESKQRVAARCVEDEVLYDYRAGKKLQLAARPFILEALQKTFELQQEAAKMNQMKLGMLSSRVRALELETWDREDAKEMFGNVH